MLLLSLLLVAALAPTDPSLDVISVSPTPLLVKLKARAVEMGYAMEPIRFGRVPLAGNAQVSLETQVWRFGQAYLANTYAIGHPKGDTSSLTDWLLALPQAAPYQRLVPVAMGDMDDGNTVPLYAGLNRAQTSLCIIDMQGSGHFESMSVFGKHGNRWTQDRSGPIMERETPMWPLDRWPFKDVPDSNF